MAIELSESNFSREVLDEKALPVLVDFWAPWCGPCRAQAPLLDELQNASGGKVKICKLNVDDNQELSARYGVMSIPTLLVFKDGEVKGKAVGLQNLPNLKRLCGVI